MPPGIGYGLMPAFLSGNTFDERRTLRRQTPPQVPFFDVLRGSRTPFTPGGMREIPSLQRFSRLGPSEQEGYAGFLEDEKGIPFGDVFALMNRLRPRGAISAAPRWVL